MRRIHFISSIIIALVMISCSTPYKSLAPIGSFNDIAYPYQVKWVTLPKNGFNIAYVDEGKGAETIIFIHGLGSYLPAWKKNIEELKASYRCIAIDLPGYGKSSKEPHSGLMSLYAGVVNELVAELNLGKVYLAGHSMGGQISITTSLLYPDIVKGLVLAAPAGFERFTEGQKAWFRDVMTTESVKKTTAEAIQNNLATNFYNLPSDAEFMVTDRLQMRSASDFEGYCYAVAQSVKGMVNEPVIDYLGKVNVPTLIVFGENDNLIPNRYLNPGATKKIAEYGHSQIGGSILVIVPKSGHFVMFEKPEVFNAEVKKFIK